MLLDSGRAHLYASHPIPSASHSIRVLQVQAAPDETNEDQIIACSLSVVDLDAHPHFAALSYVWGRPATESYQLLCDNVHLTITETCYSALWHLREKLGAFCIWIDAVCIDQNNGEEKAQLVALMGEIYANAHEVYIWLREGSPATKRAMAYLRDGGLKNYFPVLLDSDKENTVRPKLFRALWNGHVRRYSPKRCMEPGYLNITNGHTSFLRFPSRFTRMAQRKSLVSEDDLEELLRCTWTTRIWTYQEVILASSPVLVCGSDHLSWATFTYATVLLNRLTLMPCISQWTEIIASRARYSTTPGNTAIKQLLAYNQFISTFVEVDSWLARGLLFAAGLLTIGPSIAVVLIFIALPAAQNNTNIPVWAGLLLILLVLFVVVFLGILTMVCLGLALPPDPGLLAKRCSEFESSLNTLTNQSLLNNICYRDATEPHDLCFGILPMIRQVLPAPRFKVDYTVSIPQLYTQLARFFLEQCEEASVLALAAQAKCPGASSWVPNFFVPLQPISETTLIPAPSRHTDPERMPWENSSSIFGHHRRIVKWSTLHHTIFCVSNFINTQQHSTSDTREASQLHNARCMTQSMIDGEKVVKLYDGRHSVMNAFELRKPIWTLVFKEHFPREAKQIGAHLIAEYDAIILSCAAHPEQLPAQLAAANLLDVHNTVCEAFATSEDLFFITNEHQVNTKWKQTVHTFQQGQPPTISIPMQETVRFRCLGYVSGRQQGQLREGDSVVHVRGVQDYLVYRSSTKALVARLPTRQSHAAGYLSRDVTRSLDSMELVIE